MNAKIKSALAFTSFLVLTFAVAGAGGAATAPAINSGWYGALRKPTWTPPSGIFGPVWTLLYTLMAVSAWLVWRKKGLTGAHGWWSLQLALNLAWSLLFFGARKPRLALLEMLLLWLSIAATIRAFQRTDKRASALLLPYLGWVSFALALNAAIAQQNPKNN